MPYLDREKKVDYLPYFQPLLPNYLTFNNLMTAVFWKFSSIINIIWVCYLRSQEVTPLYCSYYILTPYLMLRASSLLESQEKKSPRLLGYNALCPLLYLCRSKGSLYRCIRFWHQTPTRLWSKTTFCHRQPRALSNQILKNLHSWRLHNFSGQNLLD